MQTCKTCKHYQDERCERATVRYDRGTHEEGPARRFELNVRVLDDSGLDLWLEVGPDYGCVLHEPKKD